MMKISAVIITKNEGHIIGKTLQSLKDVTDDIVVVDSGSTDNTLDICKKYNVTIIETGWDGYGVNKNKGINAAKHDWILSLDADESVDEELKQSLTGLPLLNENEVFEIRFKNYFMDKWIKYGEWGSDKHIRLFNRHSVIWSDSAVHETLIFNSRINVKRLKGNILHYTVHSLAEYEKKTIAYAKLNAQKYLELGKKQNTAKQYLSPVFSFLRNYFFRLGFLDGREGLLIAKTSARYTFLKYAFFKELINTHNS